MPIRVELLQKRRLRVIMSLVLVSLLIGLGFPLFRIFQSSVSKRYNIKWEIAITEKVHIDVYGAIIPIFFSLFLISYTILKEFPLKYYLLYFTVAVIVCRAVSWFAIDSVKYNTSWLAFVMSLLSVFVALCEGNLKQLPQVSHFTKRNYLNALAIAFSYACLSVVIVDLTYLPNVRPTAYSYIGGGGLVDAILVSGLETVLFVSIIAILVKLIMESERK